MLSVRDGRVASEQVSPVFGENYVITFREQPVRVFEQVREKLKNEQNALRSAGQDHLVYTLLDAIVSVYLAILDGVDDQAGDLQGEVLASADPLALQQIYALKEDPPTIRRAAVPAREVLGSLAGRETAPISGAYTTGASGPPRSPDSPGIRCPEPSMSTSRTGATG